MTREKNTEKNTAQVGLPEIAVSKDSRFFGLILIAGFLILLSLFYSYHHVVAQKRAVKPLEENYTIPHAALTEPNAVPETPLHPQVLEKKLPQTVHENENVTPEQMHYLQEKSKELHERLTAPLMLVNQTSRDEHASHALPAKEKGITDPNTQFMENMSAKKIDTFEANRLGNLHYLITEGTVIHADLETAINSDLPGRLRAIIREPVYSDDGTQILIPAGAKLLGEYKSGILQGQSRIFVVWERIVMGDISINLGSPGVDHLGVAGFGADRINYHFLQRFGTAALVSLMSAGVSNVGVNSGSAFNAQQEYRVAVVQSLSQSAGSLLSLSINIPPTLTKHQGAHVMVFVAHDLSFQHVLQQTAKKIMIF